ncbi:hypothetical protein AB9L18_01380 [Stenotrophomonas lactitubi]|uniref:hypothetical protein n=1 Tax=Stenotrophomonas lactitubi TaxID=2045214 RepID=UPI0035C0321D
MEILAKSSKDNQEQVIKRGAISMENKLEDVEVVLLGEVEDVLDDNVDVVIKFPQGEVRTSTFFTMKNIEGIIARYRSSGECLAGRFFWSKDMVIVEDLREETIRETIHELVRSGEYRHAFGVAKLDD